MDNVLTEPGFWAVVVLFLVVVDQAIGAALARSAYRELNLLSVQFLDHVDENNTDLRLSARQFVHRNLRFATTWYVRPAIALMAPIFAVKMVAKLGQVLRSSDRPGKVKEILAPSKDGIDPLQRAAFAAIFRGSPLTSAWVVVWVFIPILVLMTAAGQGGLIFARLRSLLWAGRTHLADDLSHHGFAQ